MSGVLIVIGIGTIISGIVVGISSGSFLGFMTALVASIMFAAISFALSRVLENQEIIISEIDNVKQYTKKPLKTLTCEHCSETYTEDYSYCPHCGRKPNSTL